MMSNLLQQLENNEAVLLMYLAGELPEADRLEVQQMLASDPALRAELTELAALQDDVTGALSRADASWVGSRRDAAVRRISRAMAAAKLDDARRPQPAALEAQRPRRRIAWWAYPIAAAAAITVGMILFSGNSPVKLVPPNTPQFVDATPAPTTIFEPSDPSAARLEAAQDEVLSLRTPESSFFDAADAVDLDR